MQDNFLFQQYSKNAVECTVHHVGCHSRNQCIDVLSGTLNNKLYSLRNVIYFCV